MVDILLDEEIEHWDFNNNQNQHLNNRCGNSLHH